MALTLLLGPVLSMPAAQEDISAQREEMETKIVIVLRLGGGGSPTVPLAAVRPRAK